MTGPCASCVPMVFRTLRADSPAARKRAGRTVGQDLPVLCSARQRDCHACLPALERKQQRQSKRTKPLKRRNIPLGNGMLPRKSYRSAGSVAHGTALPDLHTQMRGKLLDESTHPQRAPHERFDAIWEYPLEGHGQEFRTLSNLPVDPRPGTIPSPTRGPGPPLPLWSPC